jgi:hypothetical protein
MKLHNIGAGMGQTDDWSAYEGAPGVVHDAGASR